MNISLDDQSLTHTMIWRLEKWFALIESNLFRVIYLFIYRTPKRNGGMFAAATKLTATTAPENDDDDDQHSPRHINASYRSGVESMGWQYEIPGDPLNVKYVAFL